MVAVVVVQRKTVEGGQPITCDVVVIFRVSPTDIIHFNVDESLCGISTLYDIRC